MSIKLIRYQRDKNPGELYATLRLTGNALLMVPFLKNIEYDFSGELFFRLGGWEARWWGS